MLNAHSFGLTIRKNHRLLFFGAWFLINLIQAGKTELFDDEAYYWVYSRFPAWGYFDHPPAIAMLIRSGYFLFRNEFGVRLFVVCISTCTVYIISELITNRNDRLFYALTASMAVLQIGGILAVPDIPLLFFASLFFLIYRQFVRQMNGRNTVLLGIVTALMLYSKYHGLLIVFFTALSYPGLFFRYRAWLAMLITALLFLPHIYWEYNYGFPSFQFHLTDRNAGRYDWSFTTDYILGQLLMAGPFAGFILVGTAFAYRPADRLEKALKYTLAGFFLFFGFSTLKGRVEANWTLPTFIGLLVLSHQYLVSHERPAKWIYRLAIPTLCLVTIGRIYMMLDLPRSPRILKDEIHGNKKWVEGIQRQSAGLPVVFADSYQLASKYWFYSGMPSLSMNSPYGRRNNYNFWPLEDSLFGKQVYAIGPAKNPFFQDTIALPGWGKSRGKKIDHYFSFSRIQVTGENRVLCPGNYLPLFQQPEYSQIKLEMALFRVDSLVGIFPTGIVLKDLLQTRTPFQPGIPPGLTPGKYRLRYSIASGIPGTPAVNSATGSLAIPRTVGL